MRPTEPTAKTRSPRTGICATLRARLHADGSGAPSVPRRLLPASLLAIASALALATPALAAPPEAPKVEAKFITATKVSLVGFLNPNAPGEPGTYQFLYNASKTECKGGIKTPEPPGLSFGVQGEEPVAFVTGLTPGTEYTVCLVAENGAAEKATSAPLTFKTATPPETPEGEEANPIGGTTATLNGVLNPKNPGEAGTYEFLYKQGEAGCEGGSRAPEPAGASTGATPEPVSAEVKGLLPTTKYTFCLRAVNSVTPIGDEAVGAPVTFTTLTAAPTVEEAFTTEVAATSATLRATVNPGGAETSYTFEYAPSGGAFKPVPEPEGHGVIPAGVPGVPVSVHVQHGLVPGASYEFRVIVGNSVQKEVTGEAVSFTTQTAAGEFTLPDARQWEMVTPPQKQGALFLPLTSAVGGAEQDTIQASAGGGAIANVASVPTEAEPQGNSVPRLSVLSTRGPSGWSSQVIAPPHPVAGPAGQERNEYLFFSTDLSLGLVQPNGSFAPLSPEVTEMTAYLHTDYFNGNVSEHCEASYKSAASCFHPLVTAANDTASPFQPFGELEPSGDCHQSPCGPRFEAGTPDLSHVVVSSPVQLTATPIAAEAEPSPNVYEFSGGRLQLLSILPGGQEGSGRFELAGARESRSNVAARHAISNDGGRVVLDANAHVGEGHAVGLYLRDVTKGETVRLDEGTGASVEPRYMTASSDASRIFFLDSGRLTPNSGAQTEKPDLYECAISEEAGTGKDKCTLTDLTPETGGESAGVAMVLGASADGSYVYFAAAGGLGLSKPGACPTFAKPVGPICNVYVRHEGVTRLVAGLSQEDSTDWTHGGGLTEQPVRVSPHGRWLAFMSNRDLTGYDTRDAVSGRPDQEVYLYDASSNRLLCASCDPTGARPVGLRSIAALVPGWTWAESQSAGFNGAFYQSRYLSDSGRLFFDSHDALVPKDVNGTWDVYQYEPEGVPEGEHACTSATGSGSVVFKPAHGFEVESHKGEEPAGCVGLISSGTSSEASTFLDASETGGDVFFLTTSKLSPQDSDTAPDVYDAHECTTASPCLPTPAAQPPPCDTEASCKAAPTPQPALPSGGVGTAAVFGEDNIIPPPAPKAKSAAQIRAEKLAAALKACRKKHNKGKRAKCEKQAHKRYGAAKKAKRASRASNERRAK